jgi:hypothetical protein
MSKILIADVPQDSLRRVLGKSKEVLTNQDGTRSIRFQDYGKLRVTILEEDLVSTPETYYQKTTMRLDLEDRSEDLDQMITEGIREGVDYYDHFISVPLLSEPTAQYKSQNNSAVSMYKCETIFNYYPEEYEELINIRPERQIPAAFEYSSKEDFLNNPNDLLSPINLSSRRNIAIKQDQYAYSKENLNNYPYYNKLSMITDVNNHFSNFIKEIDAFDDVLGGYLLSEKTNRLFNIQTITGVDESVAIGVMDLSTWIASPNLVLMEQYLPLSEDTVSESEMVKQFKKSLLSGYVRKLSTTNYRSYKQMLAGEECYKEDFVYSIQKWRQTVAGNSLQNFYIPAEKNILGFADTQIKSGEKYIYECASHYIIVGNRYRYQNLQIFSETGGEVYATIEVHNYPSIVLVPITMFSKSVVTTQPPPLPPQVKFITKNNSSQQIDIYLSSTKGEAEGSFNALFSKDADQASDLVSMFGEDPVLFKDYDHSAMFEVYRSKDVPKSYLDFRKISDVRMPYISQDALYKDFVVPNQKVYFMFRKVNLKGLVSNPTPIYEVELLIDADDSKIIVNTYQFPEEIIKQNTKKFKSLFQIRPAVEHLIFDNEQPFIAGKQSLRETIDNISIGTEAEKSLWGNKMKFRFKSTTTGRIIDFNITFTLTKNKTEQDF